MDIHKFIENLKKYLRTTFNYEISNNAIRVYLDNEIYYDYAYLSRKLYLYERGNKSEIGYWSDIKNANLNFAMLLRNHFCGQLYDKVPNALEDCTSLLGTKMLFLLRAFIMSMSRWKTIYGLKMTCLMEGLRFIKFHLSTVAECFISWLDVL